VTPIDRLLTRALLLKEPRIPSDVIPYQAETTTPPAHREPDILPPLPSAARDLQEETAARDLQLLCETVVTQTAATSLRDFVTEQLPAPGGARVLGCVLQLTDSEHGARFWWQYAAGAGDSAASYCLYLHHMALGETDTAAWWRRQTPIDTTPTTAPTSRIPDPASPDLLLELQADASMPTVIRVLRHLLRRSVQPASEVVAAVMDYIPQAVATGYLDNPDFDLPLPRPDFADHIGVILAAASAFDTGRNPGDRPTSHIPESRSPRHDRAGELQTAEQEARRHDRAGADVLRASSHL
jgi:hypothetical protein